MAGPYSFSCDYIGMRVRYNGSSVAVCHAHTPFHGILAGVGTPIDPGEDPNGVSGFWPVADPPDDPAFPGSWIPNGNTNLGQCIRTANDGLNVEVNEDPENPGWNTNGGAIYFDDESLVPEDATINSVTLLFRITAENIDLSAFGYVQWGLTPQIILEGASTNFTGTQTFESQEMVLSPTGDPWTFEELYGKTLPFDTDFLGWYSCCDVQAGFFTPSVTPIQGGTLGGDTVVIVAAGAGVDSLVEATFDGLLATHIHVIDATSFSCQTPAHATGLVDVVVTLGDDTVITITNAYTYTDTQSAPTVDAGNPQIVLGPPPRQKQTHATVVRGDNNGTITFLWEQVSGPTGNADISSPGSLNTQITFNEYDPGTYVFKLTVTTQALDDLDPLVSSDTVAFTINLTVPPQVESGVVVVEWPQDVLLTPSVNDDGWGGGLTLVWTQLSGPGTAVMVPSGIFDPDIFDEDIFAVIENSISFPDEITGIYVFRLRVTRDDALFGDGIWKVAVIAGDVVEVENTGPVTIEINGEEQIDALLMSTSIQKNATGNPTCNFKLFDVQSIEEGNVVTIARGGVRLFGGICLSSNLTFNEKEKFYQPSLVGFAWHLGRIPITKTYENMSISAIVADLLTLTVGGTTGDFIATGLPNASIAFVEVYIDAAFNQLADLIHGHWFVDDFNKLHFAVEELEDDPLPLWDNSPYFQDLQITKDLGAVANRIIVHHTVVTPQPIPVDARIAVPSLDGYSPGGGVTTINGNTITYTGVATTNEGSLYGTIQPFFTQEQVFDSTEEGFEDGVQVGYGYSLVSPNGETPIVSSSSGLQITDPNNAVKLTFTQLNGDPALKARLRQVNVYRTSSEGAGQSFFVGSIPGNGGHFIDAIPLADIETFLVAPPSVDTSGVLTHYLTGCTGTLDTRTDSTVVVNDFPAQEDLADRLNEVGPDAGVVVVSLNGGDIPVADALAMASAYLAAVKNIKSRVSVTLKDDNARPGQSLMVFFPQYDIEEGLKIQSISLSGFELGVPHYYRVVAARDSVTLNDLVRHSLDLISN